MAPVKKVPAPKLEAEILKLLPGTLAELCPALGRKRTDNTVRRKLERLAESGEVENAEGIWQRPQPTPFPGVDAVAGYEYPEDLDPESRDMMCVKAGELIKAEVSIDSFVVDLLEDYVRSMQKARLSRAAYQARGMFQTADNGGRAFRHPGVADEREAMRDAHVYREALDKKKRKESNAGDDDDDLSGIEPGGSSGR